MQGGAPQADDERPGLVLSSRPGSNFAFAVRGTWPDPVRQALPLLKGSLPGYTGGRLS